MEELKQLIDIVKELPNTAVIVLGGYLFFKITIIGSIYGVIRLAIIKIHDAIVFYKTPKPEIVEKQHINLIERITITGEVSHLMTQIERLKSIRSSSAGHGYIHRTDIEWLKEAINAKIQLEEIKNDVK